MPRAGIADGQQDIGAGLGVRVVQRVVLVQHDVAGLDRQLAALRHGIARVHREVEQGGLQLRGIDHGQPDLAFRAGFQLHLFSEGSPQQMVGFQDDLVQIDHARLQRLLSREGQQAAHEIGAAIGGLQGDLGGLAGARVCAGPFGQHVQIADDHGQEIVEVVGDAAGQLADAFHLLRLGQLAFRHPAIGHILADGDDAGRGGSTCHRPGILRTR